MMMFRVKAGEERTHLDDFARAARLRTTYLVLLHISSHWDNTQCHDVLTVTPAHLLTLGLYAVSHWDT